MTDYEKLRELLIERGMDKKWSRMFVKKLADDAQNWTREDKEKYKLLVDLVKEASKKELRGE